MMFWWYLREMPARQWTKTPPALLPCSMNSKHGSSSSKMFWYATSNKGTTILTNFSAAGGSSAGFCDSRKLPDAATKDRRCVTGGSLANFTCPASTMLPMNSFSRTSFISLFLSLPLSKSSQLAEMKTAHSCWSWARWKQQKEQLSITSAVLHFWNWKVSEWSNIEHPYNWRTRSCNCKWVSERWRNWQPCSVI